MNAAVFLDLPNFYGHFLGSGIEKPRFLRDYFLHWLDLDLIAKSLSGRFCPVWVFYSGRRFGPSGNRIEGTYLNDYIARINDLTGVTAWDVDIVGTQREPASYVCEKCGVQGVGQWESEKGIDASLTVHMFDTMDTWDVAYLLSGDADFVPVVRSLRRRGKTVIGAGFSDASAALRRECYAYIDLMEKFFVNDLPLYRLLRKEGICVRWVCRERIDKDEGRIKRDPLGLEVRVVGEGGKGVHVSLLGVPMAGIGDVGTALRDFEERYKGVVEVSGGGSNDYRFVLDESTWQCAQRKVMLLASLKEGLAVAASEGQVSLTRMYRYVEQEEAYIPMP